MTNMARRVPCQAAGLVRTHTLPLRFDADEVTEDPSEFFTMIFGGEAFVDWYVVTPSGREMG
jgi:hypothetical protein